MAENGDELLPECVDFLLLAEAVFCCRELVALREVKGDEFGEREKAP